jgi:hypothetical protein
LAKVKLKKQWYLLFIMQSAGQRAECHAENRSVEILLADTTNLSSLISDQRINENRLTAELMSMKARNTAARNSAARLWKLSR